MNQATPVFLPLTLQFMLDARLRPSVLFYQLKGKELVRELVTSCDLLHTEMGSGGQTNNILLPCV